LIQAEYHNHDLNKTALLDRQKETALLDRQKADQLTGVIANATNFNVQTSVGRVSRHAQGIIGYSVYAP